MNRGFLFVNPRGSLYQREREVNILPQEFDAFGIISGQQSSGFRVVLSDTLEVEGPGFDPG